MAPNSGGVDTGEISVTSFGIGGVNLVKNPLEMADNEMLFAQNVEPYREQGVAGIRKRPGLQRVTGTGAVSPILGSIGLNVPTDVTAPSVYIPYTYNTGLASTDGGVTFNALATSLGDGTLLPNAKYNLTTSSPYEFMGCYSACWCPNNRVYVIGGHAAGQILISAAINNFKGVTIFPASVTADDTLVLPYPYYDWNGIEWAMAVTTTGHAALYNPANGATIALPDFTSSALATGCIGAGLDRNHWYLWVANGVNISSIRPGVDAAWTDTSVTIAGETQLLGLVQTGQQLMAGTKQSNTSGPRIVRVTMSGNTVGFSGSVTWSSGGGPLYAFGPFIINNQGFAVVGGGNGATLGGSDAFAADIVDSRQILATTGTPGNIKWTAQVPFGGLDIQAAANGFNSSTNRVAGPILGLIGSGIGYWSGFVNQVSNFISVARHFPDGNQWTFPTNRLSASSTPGYPLMIW